MSGFCRKQHSKIKVEVAGQGPGGEILPALGRHAAVFFDGQVVDFAAGQFVDQAGGQLVAILVGQFAVGDEIFAAQKHGVGFEEAGLGRVLFQQAGEFGQGQAGDRFVVGGMVEVAFEVQARAEGAACEPVAHELGGGGFARAGHALDEDETGRRGHGVPLPHQKIQKDSFFYIYEKRSFS